MLKKTKSKIDKACRKRILLIDIETSLLVGYLWGARKQYIPADDIVKDWNVICWTAKWYGDNEMITAVQTSQEALDGDDKRICLKMWNLFDKADIIVGHNHENFDIKKLNFRFLFHGFNPPLPYKTIDTCKALWKQFGPTSSKLDYVNTVLGLDVKLETGGKKLWKECFLGKSKALKKMLEYNKRDVLCLEDLYDKLRPWIKHPNMGLFIFSEDAICPTCGGTRIAWKGSYMTMVNRYECYRCLDCGSVGRARTSSLTPEDRKSLTVSI